MADLVPLSKEERRALRVVLGAKVATARMLLRLSQRQLAEKVGYSSSWINTIEHGRQFAPWWLVTALAEATGRPIGWFVGFGPLEESCGA